MVLEKNSTEGTDGDSSRSDILNLEEIVKENVLSAVRNVVGSGAFDKIKLGTLRLLRVLYNNEFVALGEVVNAVTGGILQYGENFVFTTMDPNVYNSPSSKALAFYLNWMFCSMTREDVPWEIIERINFKDSRSLEGFLEDYFDPKLPEKIAYNLLGISYKNRTLTLNEDSYDKRKEVIPDLNKGGYDNPFILP